MGPQMTQRSADKGSDRASIAFIFHLRSSAPSATHAQREWCPRRAQAMDRRSELRQDALSRRSPRRRIGMPRIDRFLLCGCFLVAGGAAWSEEKKEEEGALELFQRVADEY